MIDPRKIIEGKDDVLEDFKSVEVSRQEVNHVRLKTDIIQRWRNPKVGFIKAN